MIPLNCLSGRSGILLVILSHTYYTLLIFSLYLHDLLLNFFQTTKRFEVVNCNYQVDIHGIFLQRIRIPRTKIHAIMVEGCLAVCDLYSKYNLYGNINDD